MVYIINLAMLKMRLVDLYNENTQFTEKLTAIENVHSVSLVTYSGEFAQ